MKIEPGSLHELLPVDVYWVMDPCEGNCQLTWVDRRGVAEGKMVVASGAVEPGRSSVSVPAGWEVWAYLAEWEVWA